MNHKNVISVKGARVHNLKNISVDIPRDQLVVITGLSGSGKSSLAFDTIYAEGQRRYVESLSAYARQFLGLMDKPDVDQIDGLSPAISIDQRSTSHNPRSTVGTVTEIYDYLRLLYSRVGIPHCPNCGRVVTRQTIEQMMKKIEDLPTGTKFVILSPLVRDQKGEMRQALARVRKAGYVRVRLDGTISTLEDAESVTLEKQQKHSLDIVVDRLTIGDDLEKQRLHDSLESALDLGNGLVVIHLLDSGKEMLFSQHYSCPHCDINLPPLEPRNFSFNSPHGACPDCTGLGTRLEVDPDFVIPNKNLSLAEGAIRPWSRTSSNQGWYSQMLEAVADAHGFSTRVPVKELSKKDLEVVLMGSNNKKITMKYSSENFEGEVNKAYEGVIPNLMRRHRETESDYVRNEIERYMRVLPCPTCKGKRLKEEVLCVTIVGNSIDKVVNMTVEQAHEFFVHVSARKKSAQKTNTEHLPKEILSSRDMSIGRQILKEITERLTFLHKVGLDYLTLDRAASTLSGGEAQRIRLATQIGSSLVGVVYILDEPSIGLHQRDNSKLIETLKTLRDLGNTVLVVEHDEETIEAADYVIDIGPGAGEHGGKVIAEGTPAKIRQSKQSITGQYLSGRKTIEAPKKYRKGNGKHISIIGASEFNLKNVTVDIPLGTFVCITGVSGSGKSTLMTDILARELARFFFNAKEIPGRHKEIKGLQHLDKVIEIDQSPIGRTPRSNPATYTGVFTYIRDLFTQIPEAKVRGYGPGRFSFNVAGGRCEACEGDGLVRIEMNFLPDVYVECEECGGKRYSPQVLEIHYKGKSIADVLHMTVEEAMHFFEHQPAIHQKMKTLFDVGLGYIHLGQSATTLSGGEAQRIKLATELSRRATGKTLYILDEPTTGLHFDDVKRLLTVLQRLVDKGNTVLVIEHNLDVIKSADWIIDMGPEGGDKGGEVVVQGTPRDVAKSAKSYTGQFLKKFFKKIPQAK